MTTGFNANDNSPYAQQAIAFLTQHGKQTVVAAVLEPVLHCRVVHVTGYDTDLLGSFTRDINRLGTQLDAARRKARKGMELSGLKIGLASEGSFSTDPYTGMMPWNREIMVLIDDVAGLEIVGMAQGSTIAGQILSSDLVEIEQFVDKLGFPQQQLVVRPQSENDPRYVKGIHTREDLRHHVTQMKLVAENRKVFVEPDLRAFACPTRMQHIEKATQDLLQRMLSSCPSCAAPGYSVVQRKAGLPCEVCGTPSSTYMSEIFKCVRCHHQQVKVREDKQFADARFCPSCNP